MQGSWEPGMLSLETSPLVSSRMDPSLFQQSLSKEDGEGLVHGRVKDPENK